MVRIVAPVLRTRLILKVRRVALPDLLNGKAALTPELALRMEKAFGTTHGACHIPYDVRKRASNAQGVKRYAPA